MTTTPWSRLTARIKRYEASTESRVDEHGFRSTARLDLLRKLEVAIRDEIDRETVRAREQGASWAFIGPTKQAALIRYRKATETYRGRTRSGLTPPVKTD